uniref:type IIL restriction-modification enzyme MmeI n=1 Tax=Aquidulcibacter paucihalophilus TaxID=1978549 RepID=UPI002FCCDC2B
GNPFDSQNSGNALNHTQKLRFIRRIYGSDEFINGKDRYCLWIEDRHLHDAEKIPEIKERLDRVRATRLASRDKSANDMAKRAHQMREMNFGHTHTIVIPAVSSERREWFQIGLIDQNATISNRNFALYDAPLWNLAILSSRFHYVWIDAVCGKLETRFNYSNTLGWNTFPVPTLTEKNKDDLTRAAEEILMARETHFPVTIADLYDPEKMPANLREAHDRNDEVLERIYIGRRFKNDTERLEKLFELYTKMTANASPAKKQKAGAI